MSVEPSDLAEHPDGRWCPSRLIVHEPLVDDLVERIVARLADIAIGDPLDPNTEMGALASEAQRDKVVDYVKSAQEICAQPVAGGDRPAELKTGLFFGPSVFKEVPADPPVAREEIFGAGSGDYHLA